jgi:thiamine-phosphate pyrophosphorylase
VLPRLYPIIDASCFTETADLVRFAEELMAAGASLIQYRNKRDRARRILEQARELKQAIGNQAKLIMNDRADLCLAGGFDGVHVGQDDLSPDAARLVVGPDLWVGISTHNLEQLASADATSADYVVIGPVFPTSSKEKPDPVVAIGGVKRAGQLTRKPLVAIGGITRANCRQVIEAGADSVAVIADLLQDPRKSAEEFFRILR